VGCAAHGSGREKLGTTLEESWGNCETVTIEQGYRILKSVKR
jgi:16S rRNA G1207 methylase RsmC